MPKISQAKDLMHDRPIPGASLKADPTKKLPFQRPPQYTDVQAASQALWKNVTSEDSLPQILDMMRQGIPVADIAKVITFTGFAHGKWNQDLSLLLLEPVMYMLMYLAYQTGIDFVYSKEMPSLEDALEDKKTPKWEKMLKTNYQPKGLMEKEMNNG